MKLATLFYFVLFATLLGLASNLWMGQRAEQLQASQSELLDARVNAINELRLVQSEFDALQTLVVAYVVGKNSQHLVNYYELLDAHAGARKYAEPVDNVYWSRVIAGHATPVALLPGQAETLESRLLAPQKLVPKLSMDLKLSVDNILGLSQRLREREQVVFALTQGLYDPETRKYVSEAPVRDDLAIQMLFSEEYLGMTNSIRAEIQDRIREVETGFQTMLFEQANNLRATTQIEFYLGLLVTLLALLGLAVLQGHVLKPLRELNALSEEISKGNYDVQLPKASMVSEMVKLAHSFSLMILAFRRELEQGEAARAAERLALEAKLGRERAEAQVEARGMLLANMSHEIRTPMNAILGMTALTLKSDLPEQERSRLLKVQDAARSLLRLLNDILDFSKAEAGMVEFEQIPFQLDEVLANSFLAVQSQAANRKLLLLNEIAPGPSSQLGRSLLGDPSRLRQVLSNLLSNAVKFTESGSIRVRSSLQTRNNAMLDLRIEVHDTGPGLSKSQMERIFQKFAQADSSISRVYGGTGLGLSIAHELVTRMGGEIGVDSTQGRGSCFWFTVPLAYTSDILLQALPLEDQTAVLLHQPGVAANCVLGVLRAVGMRVELLHHAQTCVEHLKQQHCDWAIVQSDFFQNEATLPSQLATTIQQGALRLATIDRDLLSADSPLLQQLPETLVNRIAHLPHPVLPQDICAAARPQAPGQSRQQNHLEENPLLRGKHVLVLEDHPVNRELIETYLHSAGMHVTLCEEGQQAIALLDQDDAPNFDLIVTDLEMPVVDGYEFTRWLRDQTRWMDTPLVALTGHAFSEVRTRCHDLGMDGFVAKPVEAAELYATLGQLLGANQQPVQQASASVPTVQAPSVNSLPNLFLQHCSDLPQKLAEHHNKGDHTAFKREVHSMVSLLALLGENSMQQQFREFERGLNDDALHSDTVLEKVQAMWPELLARYADNTATPTPTQAKPTPHSGEPHRKR